MQIASLIRDVKERVQLPCTLPVTSTMEMNACSFFCHPMISIYKLRNLETCNFASIRSKDESLMTHKCPYYVIGLIFSNFSIQDYILHFKIKKILQGYNILCLYRRHNIVFINILQQTQVEYFVTLAKSLLVGSQTWPMGIQANMAIISQGERLIWSFLSLETLL